MQALQMCDDEAPRADLAENRSIASVELYVTGESCEVPLYSLLYSRSLGVGGGKWPS